MSDEVTNAYYRVTDALAELSGLFTEGCKLTFVMRRPGNTECEMVVTDEENLDALIETIQRSKNRHEVPR